MPGAATADASNPGCAAARRHKAQVPPGGDLCPCAQREQARNVTRRRCGITAGVAQARRGGEPQTGAYGMEP